MARALSLKTICLILLAIILTIASSACGKVSEAIDVVSGNGSAGSSVEEDPGLPDRDNSPQIYPVEAPGTLVFSGNGATVDYSNSSDGYVMVKYEGDNPKIKMQIIMAGTEPYTYDITPNIGYVAFPFSLGNGSYEVSVLTNVEGDRYAKAVSETIDVALSDPLAPFLRPGQFSNFTADSALVSKAVEISAGAKSDLGAVERMFLFVTDHVEYDYDKAATVQSGYIPNPDDTLATGKGICFDYASLMTSMLRSQGIPCELTVGFAGDVYHAWIAVYSKESGEVAKVVKFESDTWTSMDPTFFSNGDKGDPNLIGSGGNYNPLYHY